MKHPLWGNTGLPSFQTMSHAYLVSGGNGSGRGALISHLSQRAMCPGEDKPCGTCVPCTKISRHTHPDVTVYGREKVPNVAEIRAMREDMFLLPGEGQRKIAVILGADRLNPQSQNALLKILEEPPPYALFFLVTAEGTGVLETIRSRCQILRLHPLSYEQSLAYLQQRFPNQENLPFFAQECQGFVGRAVEKLKPPPLPTPQAPPPGLKPVRKKQAPTPPPPPEEPQEDTWKPEPIAQAILQGLYQGESALLAQTRPLAKLKKDQILAVVQECRGELSTLLGKHQEKQIYDWILSLEEVTSSLEANVSPEQISCLLCALLFQQKRNAL